MTEINFDYDSTMYVEYELREGAQNTVTEKVLRDVKELFMQTEYDKGVFALVYDGNKKIKLAVPYEKGSGNEVWVGYALGQFNEAMRKEKLVDYWCTTVDEEHEVNCDVEYSYTGTREELEWKMAA